MRGSPWNWEIQSQGRNFPDSIWALPLVYIPGYDVGNCCSGIFNGVESAGTRHVELAIQLIQFGFAFKIHQFKVKKHCNRELTRFLFHGPVEDIEGVGEGSVIAVETHAEFFQALRRVGLIEPY
jgi:hypothetical protein